MASVWEELKRRNVVKVAVAYAIVGWLLIEISSVLGSALILPDWATSLVAFFVILGFPLALVLSWAYVGHCDRTIMGQFHRWGSLERFNFKIQMLIRYEC
jgi:hypothetical protein